VVTLPWMYGDVLPQIKRAYALRYRLMPHIYAAMHRGAAAHVPPLRPLAMDFADDPRAMREDECFLLGDGLLVAPVLDKGATKRTVYLPKHPHGWYDFHSGNWLAGGAEATIDAPLGRIPLFVAGGSMIALSEQLDRIDPPHDTVRRLRVFAHRGAASTTTGLYDDDGVTPDWDKGAGRSLALTVQTDGGGRATLTVASSGRYVPAYGKIKVETVGGNLQLAPGAERWLEL